MAGSLRQDRTSDLIMAARKVGGPVPETAMASSAVQIELRRSSPQILNMCHDARGI